MIDVTTLLTVLSSGICTDALDAHDGVGPCEVLQVVIDTGELSLHLCKHAVGGSIAIEQQLI